MHIAATPPCIKAVWLGAGRAPVTELVELHPADVQSKPQSADLSFLLGSVSADFADIGSPLRPSRRASLTRRPTSSQRQAPG
jgi:hypothetical protein